MKKIKIRHCSHSRKPHYDQRRSGAVGVALGWDTFLLERHSPQLRTNVADKQESNACIGIDI